ncbi:1-aminocyclopropane-1-carboxylate deaminase/D-cysteine desulfhydrase [Gallaecimonas sp. GXIMD1310]|uniref:1-aminocyclopropane-1-carboxylate deaminase/D-cysteine desulfhydrase n=1 Tax=Gallaecimonas sp. GXIMD1310 TaxID=3131926 RepID=UPI0032534700
MQNNPASPLVALHHPLLTAQNCRLWVKRDDLLHPLISGNKWRKLQQPLARAKAQHCPGIVSLGGPHSNHLLALAAACQARGLASHGIVRGHQQQTPTLQKVQTLGMTLSFVSRQYYRQRHEKTFWLPWQQRFPGWLLLAEGGSSTEALPGVAAVIDELDVNWQQLWVPVGSGGTLAGLVHGSAGRGTIIGVPAVRDSTLADKITQLLEGSPYRNYRLLSGFEGPGFGRFSTAQAQQMRTLATALQVPLEPIYGGKLLLALWQQLSAGKLAGQSLVWLHTGGLQGLEALRQQGRWL